MVAQDVAVGFVVEQDGDQVDAEFGGGGQVGAAEEKAAIAGEGDDGAVGVGDLYAEGGGEAVAEGAGEAGGHEPAWLVDRVADPGDVADLGHFIDQDAVIRHGGADGGEHAHLRLDLGEEFR